MLKSESETAPIGLIISKTKKQKSHQPLLSVSVLQVIKGNVSLLSSYTSLWLLHSRTRTSKTTDSWYAQMLLVCIKKPLH